MHCLLLQKNSMQFLILQILFHNVLLCQFTLSCHSTFLPSSNTHLTWTAYTTTTSVYYQLLHQWQYLPTNHQSRRSFPAIQTTVIHCCVLCLRVLIGRCSQSRMLLHISPVKLDDMTTSCPVTLASCLTTTAIHSYMPDTRVAVWSDNRIYQLEMWANAQRDGRPAECRWRPLFNAAVWLTPTTRVPCSNTAKTRNPLKLPGVPQTHQQISAARGL